ncbi:MAG: WG repeat-containing protein [Bacteroidetes bacterium]|nr:WG repeat-containing protein [Bacteroidota bacterium]
MKRFLSVLIIIFLAVNLKAQERKITYTKARLNSSSYEKSKIIDTWQLQPGSDLFFYRANANLLEKKYALFGIKKGNTVLTEPKYDLDKFYVLFNNFIRFSEANGGWGLIDLKTGEEKVPAIYLDIFISGDDLAGKHNSDISRKSHPNCNGEAAGNDAIVLIKDGGKRMNQIGLLNKYGALILPVEFGDITKKGNEYEVYTGSNIVYYDLKGTLSAKVGYAHIYPFINGWSIVENESYKKGIVDQNKKELLPMQYTFIDTSFKNGLLQVKDKNFIGFLDYNLKLVIPARFITAHFTNKYILAKDEKGNWGVLDTIGRNVLPFEYSELSSPNSNDKFVAAKNNKYGIVDASGKELLPFQFDKISGCQYGMCMISQNGKYGYLSYITNEVIIPPQYLKATSFKKYGRARVNNDLEIDKTGKTTVIRTNSSVSGEYRYQIIQSALNNDLLISTYDEDWLRDYTSTRNKINDSLYVLAEKKREIEANQIVGSHYRNMKEKTTYLVTEYNKEKRLFTLQGPIERSKAYVSAIDLTAYPYRPAKTLKCPDCKGIGKRVSEEYHAWSKTVSTWTCTKCNGTGEIWE